LALRRWICGAGWVWRSTDLMLVPCATELAASATVHHPPSCCSCSRAALFPRLSAPPRCALALRSGAEVHSLGGRGGSWRSASSASGELTSIADDERANPSHTEPHPAARPYDLPAGPSAWSPANALHGNQRHVLQHPTMQQQHAPFGMQQQHLMHSAAAGPGRPVPPQPHPHPAHFAAAAAASARPAHPHPQSALPKQQITTVLNAMTSGGQQHFHAMDGYDLANLHAMNARYLQQLTAQRSYMQHPQRRPDIPPPSAALFAAKM